jgi:hypothetical protein
VTRIHFLAEAATAAVVARAVHMTTAVLLAVIPEAATAAEASIAAAPETKPINMDATEFTFDEATHTYRLGGEVLPSITQVMARVGLTDYSMVPASVLAAAQARGSAVHVATQLYDIGTLDYATLDPAIYPYLQAWLDFCRDYKFDPSFIEQPLHNGQYAGTPDRVGDLLWGKKRMPAVVEIKTSAVGDDAPGVQMAAQEHLLKHNQILDPKKQSLRLAVHLADNGKYRAELHDNPNDLAVFMSCLTIYNYFQRKAR